MEHEIEEEVDMEGCLEVVGGQLADWQSRLRSVRKGRYAGTMPRYGLENRTWEG